MPYRAAIQNKENIDLRVDRARAVATERCGAAASKDYFSIVSLHNSPVGLAERISQTG